jgi:pyruvate/2-oxoglutarate dehydrogenase complex dihydrolipoamide dehydrogenase (E3) component
MKAVKARKDAVVAAFRNGVERSLKTLQGCTVYQGHGRFISEKKVVVNDSELVAGHIFLNVGGRAVIPPIPGLDRVPCLTNSLMMDIDFLPTHLVILGGSYVGLEFAQMYRRFGSEVTVIELGSPLISREETRLDREHHAGAQTRGRRQNPSRLIALTRIQGDFEGRSAGSPQRRWQPAHRSEAAPPR